MSTKHGSKAQKSVAENLVSHFETQRQLVQTFLDQVLASLDRSESLMELIHSIKPRTKDPIHLRDKLIRKMVEADKQGAKFDITKNNLLTKVTDLAGIRLLHLHTRQFADIDLLLRDIFEEQQYELIEGPFARTWDDESREYFGSIGVSTQESATMYTSVHYVIGSASRTPVTCEVQVRTLAEEVWGEVDHALNYPDAVCHLACREQIRALARATSTVTRLVDSIFMSYEDLESLRKKTARRTKKVVKPKTAGRRKAAK